MATKVTTANVLRYHFLLNNGGTRYIDVDNPIDDTNQIKQNIGKINEKLDPNDDGQYAGVIVSDQYFNGDTDAFVTSVASAEIIQTTKTVVTREVF